ncbi:MULTISPECIES: non-ribosomal peptide synthetase [Streptomyces]|uniref:non-ribosomal peptide synthetase n=1 Tax=Streptomyces TaxID=1883 RepID=UPI001E502F44|nr:MULTISPECIES: non-ribosomal peptide synthetase [Streptomyces]UFQ18050.1 amino acid adenylation domain-containing protein [Streptomyces huasconensis]WCL87661.1 non-ribosomal peptide synthetase [Streptomyces sp. JCM 35825]
MDAPHPAPAPADEEYEFPVSDAQSRLLVLDRMNPGTAQYNVPAAFAVHGPFDPGALARALDAVVARHEALRTVFRTAADGSQAQIVSATGRAHVTVEKDVRAAEAADRMRADAARPFDPATGPLLRCTVYAVDDGSHRVLLVAHHLICDGWSLGVLLRDLSAAYEAQAGAGAAHPLPEPPLQYPDFAAWQRDRQAEGAYAEAVAHWAGRLRGAPDVVSPPLDRPRPAVRSAAGGSAGFLLDAGLRARLAGAARARGATPFMALFAAYAAFLGRLTGRDDLVIGFPVSGRDRPELQEMVGMLTNTLALRVDLSGDPSYGELIDRVRAELLAGQPYQDAPFESVVDALAPPRDTSHDPVVQLVFAYDDDTDFSLALPGARVERLELALDTAKFDFHLHVERWEEGDSGGAALAARFIYRADLFEATTVRAWARNFRTLLDAALTRPDAPLSTLDAVPAEERRRAVAAADRTAGAAPVDRLVPDLIADVAAARPDATALVCGDVRLTYRELLGRADALAARLRAAGVRPGFRVGLLLPRSPEMGIAALAVLRAGGAYVPLDRAHPHARLAHMAETSGTGLLLTAAETAAQGERLGIPCLRADAPGATRPTAPPQPAAAPAPDDLAYVLFTSGSTGVPKGVAVEHRALANLTGAVRHAFPVTADDRVLQCVSFGFDVAVSDLFFPWVAGAELHIARDDERLGDALHARLRDSRITYVFLPPSAAMLLPDSAGGSGGLPHLRTLAVGGEACPAELVERLSAPGRRIVNAYGPSEATVYATTADLEPGEPVVIGAPVPGARVYVLDARLRTVPTGVTGEVYIAGASLARGYIGRPGLTAERFVADPYGPPGTRMYRTGDLARVDARGRLHYLGRSDSQVKLRGIRIELGEIEALLAGSPDVAVAAAAVHGGGAEQRLVAYVVPRDGATPSDEALRAHLAERLPGYMLPEEYVRLDALPLNRSGKIDRPRLPAPGAERRASRRTYVAARTATERRVADVWARVLTLDRVGVHDNFFELGGNSVRLVSVLDALRATAAAGPETPVDLTLVDLFRHPTVASIAAHLDRATGEAPATATAAERRGGERRARQTAAAQRLRSSRSRKGTSR